MVSQSRNNEKLQSIEVADIDIALQMLTKFLNEQDINPLLSALETLKTEPQNQAYQEHIVIIYQQLRLIRLDKKHLLKNIQQERVKLLKSFVSI